MTKPAPFKPTLSQRQLSQLEAMVTLKEEYSSLEHTLIHDLAPGIYSLISQVAIVNSTSITFAPLITAPSQFADSFDSQQKTFDKGLEGAYDQKELPPLTSDRDAT